MSPFRISLSFFVLALLGVVLASRLSLSFTNPLLTSSFTIAYSLSEATPTVVEQQATALLENALSDITGIQKISSKSGYGSGSITLEFNSDEDLAFKKIEILTTLRRLKKQLPERMSFPLVTQQNDNSEKVGPLLQYNVSSPEGIGYVQERITESIIPQLGTLEGVSDIQLSGLNSPCIELAVNVEKMTNSGITLGDIRSALNSHASVSFHNSIKEKNVQIPIVAGYALDEKTFRNIPVTPDLTIADLGAVYFSDEQPDRIRRINGRAAILLSVYAQTGTNRINAADEVEKKIAELQKQPSNDALSIIKRFDDTTYLRDEIHKSYYRSGFSILILCLFIFISSFKWRPLLVLFSGLLVNIGIVLLIAYLLEVDIHLYTLAGLTVSFGLLVDNALVMLDHYEKYKNKKILTGLMAASLTTVAAVAIIFFLPPEDRDNLTDFAWIVIISLSCSLMVAWLFTPAISDLLLTSSHDRKRSAYSKRRNQLKLFIPYHQMIRWLARKRVWLVVLIILAFGLPVYLLPVKWEGHDFYNKTIGSDYFQEEVRPITDRILGGSSRLFYRNVFEGGGYRNPEKTKLYMNARLPFGHTLEQMDQTIQKVENYLRSVDGVSLFLTDISSGQSAQITIEFDEKEEHGSLPYSLKSRLTSKALDWGGVEWNIYGVGQGFSNGVGESTPSFQVQLKGHQFDKLGEIADTLAKKLLAHKRIQKVNTNDHISWGARDLEELVMAFNPHVFDYDPATFSTTLQQAADQADQETASLYVTLRDQRLPVYIHQQNHRDFSPYYLLHHPFGIPPLAAVGSINHHIGTPEIHKENRQYLRRVSFDYYGSSQFGQKYLDQVLAEMAPDLPSGFEISQKSYRWFNEKEQRQYELVPLLILIIYLICVVFFENFHQPLLIIFIIPSSFIGLFLIFAWGDFSFDQGGYAAFIMLGGLVVNSAIFIFTDYQQQHTRLQSRRVAKAIYQKAWPITLTVVSTCVGLVPFLINGDKEVFWFSLAIGMIGGLCFSVLLTFFVLPALMIKKSKLVKSRPVTND